VGDLRQKEEGRELDVELELNSQLSLFPSSLSSLLT